MIKQMQVYSNVDIFWDIAPYSANVNRRFGGTHHVHLQGSKSAEQETNVKQVARQGTFVKRRVKFAKGQSLRSPSNAMNINITNKYINEVVYFCKCKNLGRQSKIFLQRNEFYDDICRHAQVPKAPGSNHTNMADGKLFSSSSV
jgi:hypothetical protein